MVGGGGRVGLGGLGRGMSGSGGRFSRVAGVWEELGGVVGGGVW